MNQLATRIPKQERSARTQQRLLEATIAQLGHRGYAELRTADVARRCNVSQGTVFAHYGTKVRLVVAAVEHYFASEVRVDMISEDPKACTVEERVRSVLGQMWLMMRSDEYLGVLEVYSAARTNEELRDALAPVAAEEIEHTTEIGTQIVSLILSDEDSSGSTDRVHDDSIGVVVLTLQAAARESAAIGQHNPPEGILGFLETLMVRELVSRHPKH